MSLLEKIGENVKIKKLGITGGLASGKSTVCQILEEYGAYQVSSDAIVHQLLLSDPDCIREAEQILGSGILVDGRISRYEVGKIVFSHPEKLKALERLLHPRVLLQLEADFERVKSEEKFSYFAVEVPLLFEAGWDSFFDVTIAVISDEKNSIARYLASSHTLEEYHKRMNRQLEVEEKAKKADYTLTNNGDLQTLREEIKQMINTLENR